MDQFIEILTCPKFHALLIGLASGIFIGYNSASKNSKKLAKKLRALENNRKSALLSGDFGEIGEHHTGSGYDKINKNTEFKNLQSKLYSSSMVDYLKRFGIFNNPEAVSNVRNRTFAELGPGPNRKDTTMMIGDTLVCQLMSLVNLTAGSTQHIEVGVYSGYNMLQQAIQLKENTEQYRDFLDNKNVSEQIEKSPVIQLTDNEDGTKSTAKFPDYRIYGLDNTAGYMFLCRRFYAEAGLNNDHIDFRCQPAAKSLEEMINDENLKGKISSAFIDADKINYKTYYNQILELVRPGGMIFLDNILWSGTVIDYCKFIDEGNRVDDWKGDPVAKYLHELNEYIQNDPRTRYLILPIGDGLGVAVKL